MGGIRIQDLWLKTEDILAIDSSCQKFVNNKGLYIFCLEPKVVSLNPSHWKLFAHIKIIVGSQTKTIWNRQKNYLIHYEKEICLLRN